MPYIRIWIHLVWSTKNREPLLTMPIRSRVFDHIRENAKVKDIFLDSVNGYVDHVHCLISLGAEQMVAKTTQLIKGESSFWVNKNRLTTPRLDWQDEYFAVSVGESQVKHVRQYIQNQEEHHRKKSFGDEVDEFIEKYGFQRFDDLK